VPVYRWVDHTAELELELDATSECELLTDALHALAELLDPGESDVPAARATAQAFTEHIRVQASATDRPALLAAWLEELLYAAETGGFIPLAVEHLSLEQNSLEATVSGVRAAPRPLVKAVTYHRLEFEPAERGYRGRVVLDV
jgi:SHS2 domain-containing protein